MASTVRLTLPRGNDGTRRKTYGTYNAGVYATGGVAADPKLFGLKVLDFILFEDLASGTQFVYDRSANKVKVFVAAGTEQVNATDMSTSAFTTRYMAVGR